MRLPKVIARAGIASRRRAEVLIRQGRVSVNGQVVKEPATFIEAGHDHIKVNGRLVRPPALPVYVLLNKPKGVVTTLDDPEGRPTVVDLLKGVKDRVFPVGRLDYQTEGLLLLTNDGDLAHRLLHPRYGVEKAYLAKVKGMPTNAALERIRRGIYLQAGVQVRARVKIHRVLKVNTWLEIILQEGRHREVRRILEAIGHPVLALKRTRFGPLTIKGLPIGHYRRLMESEIRSLQALAIFRASREERRRRMMK